MPHSETYESLPNSLKAHSAAERREWGSKELVDRRSSDSKQFGELFRSPVMWNLLFVPALLALAAVIYMISNLHPGPGRVPGVGDSASPNAQPGDIGRG